MTTVKSVPSVSRFASGNSCNSSTAAIAVGTSALTTPVDITSDATPVRANVSLSRDEVHARPQRPTQPVQARATASGSAHEDEKQQRQRERSDVERHRRIVSRHPQPRSAIAPSRYPEETGPCLGLNRGRPRRRNRAPSISAPAGSGLGARVSGEEGCLPLADADAER